MKTPIYNFLKNYNELNPIRCHMPGHKGKSPVPELNSAYSLDITEISGADSLFEADGIIQESEKIMSGLYGTYKTFYSAGGSTSCIQAMLTAMKYENRTVIAVRNVHRSFINTAVLLDLEVKWLMPDYSEGILSGTVDLEKAEYLLKNTENPCFYVTSPDYTGKLADIANLSKICHKYNAPLIVDNAHGSHLHFFERSMHPIALGADMCCDSAHKMLPALTGASMLHVSDKKYSENMKQYMTLFCSTSPSYLIMLSLDLCTEYISADIKHDIKENCNMIDSLKEKFSGKIIFADTEPFHITASTGKSGYSGTEFAEILRKNNIECEYSDREIAVMLMSPMCDKSDYKKLSSAIEKTLETIPKKEPFFIDFPLKLPKKAMSMRKAVFSANEEIPVEQAENRICSAVRVPCPPAVPIVASGEVIDKNSIKIFKNYGISSVIVVK